jgi:hypothetical protein
MLNRFFGPKTHDNINMFAVFALAVGIPVSKVVMSLATLILAVNFLLNADFKGAWERCKKNFVFWFVILVLAFHLLGLLYTTDMSYALRDLNTKLPFLAIPIVLIAYPIKERFLNYVFYGFLIALLITSFVNIKFMLGNEAEDYRDFSLFGSHIRYGLLIITGTLLSIYLLLQNRKMWIIYVILISWFSYYTITSQVFSGYVALLFLLLGCFIYFIKTVKSNSIKVITAVCFLSILGIGVFKLYDYLVPDEPFAAFKNLPEFSENGEKYFNDTTSLWFENGHHVLSLIAGNELEKAWNKRSEIDFREKLDTGYDLKGILLRYMTSKGLTKDKAGMASMSDQDIKNVEQSMSSIRHTYGTFESRLAGLRNEVFHYSIGGDPDGNSLLQRFEHWKTGKLIIKNNWLIGVGTGDLQEEFNQAYILSNSQLDEVHWNRAHNQFMTFWISFGIFGFVVFTGFWLWFLWRNIKLNNLIGICFTLIAIGSFLSEDTIETQQGVTYIAFFLGISALINFWKKEKIIKN